MKNLRRRGLLFNQKKRNPHYTEYLTFTALQNCTFTLTANSSCGLSSISYSLNNGNTWTTRAISKPSGSNTVTFTTPSVSAGKTVLWKGTGNGTSTNSGSGSVFTSTGKFNASGNLMSLLFGDNFVDKNLSSEENNYAFAGLFMLSTNLVSISDLVFPSTLSDYCFRSTFYGCTSLNTLPEELPATILADSCYREMFSGCTGLTSIPSGFLPGTTLVDNCYQSMFRDCTGLTTAPELPATTLAQYCYVAMFYGCTGLTSVPSTLSSVTTLANSCYSSMFNGCTGLTTLPSNLLPVTTLANNCYSGMFASCTSLTTLPSNLLPATILANSCYSSMFSGCKSLTTAPELPATRLTNSCYSSMFSGCTGLTTAPELPATTLAQYCYHYMFNGCSKLNYIKALFTTTPGDTYTSSWVNGVASTGTFVKNPEATWGVTGVNGVPTGWVSCNSYDYNNFPTNTTSFTPQGYVTFTANEPSVIALRKKGSHQTLYISKNGTDWADLSTAACSFDNGQSYYVCGNLTANNTTSDYTQFNMKGSIAASGNGSALWNYSNLNAALKEYCGYCMFEGCTSLTSAPELPATTLSNSCYRGMFLNCTSLTTAPSVLPATTLAQYCYHYMFNGCKSLTTIPSVLPATRLMDYCYAEMFNGCKSLTTAPELPATTLAQYCYYDMFCNCYSLTTVPDLPATTLAKGCYFRMFSGCKSLTSVPSDLLPATTLAQSCYYGMFMDVPLTTAPVLPATTLVSSCYEAMFMGCSKLNYIKAMFLTTPSNAYTRYWVNGVAPNGVFVRNPSASWDVTNGYGAPTGWFVTKYETNITGTTQLESPSYVTITNIDKIGLWKKSSHQTLYISNDHENWEQMYTERLYSSNDSKTIYMCGNLTYNNTASDYTQFYIDGTNVSMSGNGGSIWNYSNPNAALKECCGYCMFEGCTSLTSVSSNFLPATSLTQYCYARMFFNCTSLTTAPELPATSLAQLCYTGMFYGCKSLTTAPSVLPATRLIDYCYSSMFSYCTSLTTAPVLPAITLANKCYTSMFQYCSSLNYIKAMFTSAPGDNTWVWVDGVAATGTFVKNSAATWNAIGSVGIPTGWTVETASS